MSVVSVRGARSGDSWWQDNFVSTNATAPDSTYTVEMANGFILTSDDDDNDDNGELLATTPPRGATTRWWRPTR